MGPARPNDLDRTPRTAAGLLSTRRLGAALVSAVAFGAAADRADARAYTYYNGGGCCSHRHYGFSSSHVSANYFGGRQAPRGSVACVQGYINKNHYNNPTCAGYPNSPISHPGVNKLVQALCWEKGRYVSILCLESAY